MAKQYRRKLVNKTEGLPSGCFVETGAELNAYNTEDNFRSYDNVGYYITTDDGQEPVGPFATEAEAIAEAWKIAEA